MNIREKVINYVINSKPINNYIWNILKDNQLQNDFRQELYLIIMEKDENELEEMYSKIYTLKKWLFIIVRNQLKSYNSPFYTKYIKYNNSEDVNDYSNMFYEDYESKEERQERELKEDIEEAHTLNKLNRILNHSKPTDAHLFKEMYYNEKTYTEISIEYGINYQIVRNKIMNIENLINELIKNNKRIK